ncbi:hypothetical protein BC831DRAFT_481576 [Entophlyctis helioformis]|nr:hypothetical protein BC831DRAFT_481576 [Entophlyctis helioformis]
MPSLVAAQRLPSGVQKVEPSPKSAYCAQFRNVKEGTGSQFQNGEGCVSTPQGLIPDVNQMVSSLIFNPQDGSNVDASKGFRIEFNVRNLATGVATKADSQFLLSPQTLSADGKIEGLTNIVVQRMTGNRAPDARDFDFFDSFEAESRDGTFSVNVPAGAIKQNGEYRICTMAASASHQPVVMPVAQRGAQDDCVRVNVTGANGGNLQGGNNNNNNGQANNNNGQANNNNGQANNNNGNNGQNNNGNNGQANDKKDKKKKDKKKKKNNLTGNDATPTGTGNAAAKVVTVTVTDFSSCPTGSASLF